MPIFERDGVRIRYEETGSGFPLLVIPGGGLSSGIATLSEAPFDPIGEFSGEYRCIVADIRNGTRGESFGPVEVDRPWEAYTDDQVALMDHLGIEKFMVMGFCIGGPLIWNLLQRSPERVVAAVLVAPSGFRQELPDRMYNLNAKGWIPPLLARHPEVTDEMAHNYLKNLYARDFVYTVSREFVQKCETPVLVLPDDALAHPYVIAMETARLAPNAQVSLYPWQVPADLTPLALRHVRMFLRTNR